MESTLEKQIELFKKYGITNYYINDDNTIIINQTVNLSHLTEIESYVFDNCIINSYLDLKSLLTVHKNFLKNATVNNLILDSVTEVHGDFLKNTNVNYLSLSSLTNAPNNFLKNNVIVNLYLTSLKVLEKDFLKYTKLYGIKLNLLIKENEDNIKHVTIKKYV